MTTIPTGKYFGKESNCYFRLSDNKNEHTFKTEGFFIELETFDLRSDGLVVSRNSLYKINLQFMLWDLNRLQEFIKSRIDSSQSAITLDYWYLKSDNDTGDSETEINNPVASYCFEKRLNRVIDLAGSMKPNIPDKNPKAKTWLWWMFPAVILNSLEYNGIAETPEASFLTCNDRENNQGEYRLTSKDPGTIFKPLESFGAGIA